MLHYINLDTDKEAYDNLETFLKSVYDNKGRLKKNYQM